ncbi:scabin-related ADP-ribosyltransferase [Streptomyces lunaelactis]|uniref:scabin-related ADP-ribosyltransferase n=1 Tax=Streptomyces lunaelactis TaxID=1535768 RepID=UPI00158596CC|nr:hypothetical protein [Streptomyces lunaelactis]NUK27319.1 hypothetical protein [Streptomyces lunaelactis]
MFATTAAVQTTGENLGTDVESVARALGEYANEIRPLVARLETLRSEATAFVAEAERGHALINNWQRDQDKIDKNEELVNGVTATTTAFWEAERTAANKIMALFSCIKYRANDGSNKPDMYGFSAEALKDAELPWGSVEERTYLPGNIDRHIKSFVWDGLIVDNIWGTIQGLGALVGIGADASDTWAALGRVFLGAGDYLQDPLNDRPGGLGEVPLVQESRKDAKEFAKGLVAWDMWAENPARASATVVFNILTLGVGPLKAGTAAKAGLGAKAAGTAAKIGELLDPVSATVKAAGAAAPKIAEITAGLRKSVPDLPDLVDGSVRLPDGSLLNTIDGELVITRPDGSVAGKAPGEMSAADRAALDQAARSTERPPATVTGVTRNPGATAHAGENLPRATHEAPGSGPNSPSAAAHASAATSDATHGTDSANAGHGATGHSPAGHGHTGEGGSNGDWPGGSEKPAMPGDEPDRLAAATDRNIDLDGLGMPAVWRTDDVPLYRSDNRPPEAVFESGFESLDPSRVDLAEYVEESDHSAFVSTSYRDDIGDDFGGKYTYEIDVPGGIDVNASMGDHPLSYEKEVAFPGGIRPEYIKGARPYDYRTGEVGDLIPNPNYRPEAERVP